MATDDPPTVQYLSFAIPLAVTKHTTTIAADPTTTTYLPSAIHLANRDTADVDGFTTSRQCLDCPPTVAQTTLPAVTTHPVILAHFTADTINPTTSPSIVCTSTTDNTSLPATDADPDATNVSVSWSIQHNPAVN